MAEWSSNASTDVRHEAVLERAYYNRLVSVLNHGLLRFTIQETGIIISSVVYIQLELWLTSALAQKLHYMPEGVDQVLTP